MRELGPSITVSSDKDEDNGDFGECGLIRNGGSFAERRAARCGAGFTAPRITAPPIRSPCLTIPPGISPAALLDSPVMFLSTQDADVDCHTTESEQLSIEFELPAEFSSDIPAMNCPAIDSSKNPNFYTNAIKRDNDLHDYPFDIASDQKGSTHREDNEPGPPAEEDPKRSYSGVLQRTSADGYNWRKYGQKQVKGSEYPRSYYKCTYSNCPVKKKVERSYDGEVTEIIYKGAHNHEKPWTGSASFLADALEMAESSHRGIKIEREPARRNVQSGSANDFQSISDRRADGVERTSPTSVVSVTELSDPFSSTNIKTVGSEPAGTADMPSTFASRDDDDRANDVDGEESKLKRRCTDSYFDETNFSSRAIREPRIVIQIESKVDILEDGYRWRKYGQKVVKGNPNPRSYYKCTSDGCSVRKHVERASTNLKCVLMTYEGRHDHGVPAARSSNEIASIPDAAHSSNALPPIIQAACVSGTRKKVRFDRKPEFNDAYFRPGWLGNLSTDAKIYPLKIPFLQNPIPYGSFGLDPKYAASSHSSCITSIAPDFPISPPLNPSLSAPGLNLVGSSQLKDDNFGLVRPKQEENDDRLSHLSMAALDNVNLSPLPWSSPPD